MGALSSSLLPALLLVSIEAQYTGSGPCASCHPAIADRQAKSGHARALAPGAPEADWAFGSGTHATTWVRQQDPRHYLELPLSWYRQTNRKAHTPGHTSISGVLYRTFDPAGRILRCFACHSTGVPSVDAAGRISPHEPGVRCESCHGPAAAHVRAGGGKFNIENPGRYRAAAINDQCGACHRQPDASSPRWDDPWNVRHQPIYLAESSCFLNSGGKLSCLNCHNPHEALSRDTRAYAAVCSQCHAQPRHRTPVSPDCIRCHMPRVPASADLSFTNHWIGVYSPGRPLRPRR